MTIDEDSKLSKSRMSKPKRKKSRKVSDDDLKFKFESLMKSGENMEMEVRMMDSKLRKLTKKSKKTRKLKSIMKKHDISKKQKIKGKVAFDLVNIEYI